MKSMIVAMMLTTSLSGCAAASSGEATVVQNSIGKLLLSHDEKYSYQNDLNPFGSAVIFDEFIEVYNKNIKGLKKEERLKFFWSAMWHLDFDGHYMFQFQKLILDDCGEEFIKKLEDYIKKETELQRNKTRLYLSEKVLAGLNSIKARRAQ